MTAFGVYNFYINGEKVGNAIMAPGWTYYTKWAQYQTYDITGLLGGYNIHWAFASGRMVAKA